MKITSGTLTLFLAANAMAADLNFNLLDDCNTLRVSFSMVQSATLPSGSSCRSANGPIEKAIRSTFEPSGNNLCFLHQPPVPALSGFQCLAYSAQGETPLVCYRQMSSNDINHYQTNYRNGQDLRANAYLDRAKQCRASSGDTAAAGPTLMPYVLAVAGKSEVAFISALGSKKPPDSAAVHGFATASPEMKSKGIDAFEYFSVYQSTRPVIQPIEIRGNWRLTIDDGSDFDSQTVRIFRKAGIPMQLRVFGMDIRRDVNAPPYSKSPSLTQKLAESIVSSLENEGFEELDQNEIASKAGIGGGDIMSAMRDRLPWGTKSLALDGENHAFRMLIKTTGSMLCLKNDRGAFGAGIIHSDGIKGAKYEFGGIAVMFFGVGSCGTRVDPQRKFLTELTSNTREKLFESLP